MRPIFSVERGRALAGQAGFFAEHGAVGGDRARSRLVRIAASDAKGCRLLWRIPGCRSQRAVRTGGADSRGAAAPHARRGFDAPPETHFGGIALRPDCAAVFRSPHQFWRVQVDAGRQWSTLCQWPPMPETPWKVFCRGRAIGDGAPRHAAYADSDPRFADKLLVTDALHIDLVQSRRRIGGGVGWRVLSSVLFSTK